MSFFMRIFGAKNVIFTPKSNGQMVKPSFGAAGGAVATKGGTGKGTEVFALPVTTKTYQSEMDRVSTSCASALQMFATLPAQSAYSSLDKEALATANVTYWTVTDGKPGSKSISPEYLTKLRLSAYNCIDADPKCVELDILRGVMYMDKLTRIYFQYLNVLKVNDSLAKTARTRLDTIEEIADHGHLFAADQAASAGALSA